MKEINRNKIVGYAATALIFLGASFPIWAVEPRSIPLDQLKAFDGQPVEIKEDQLTHLIFQEIWSSYEGQGEEKRVAALPESFKESSQQIWVQPGLNVTEAQLTEFQGYFPQIAPLLLDRGFSLMRSFEGWDLPLHVILKGGKKVFSGNGDALTEFTQQHFSSPIVMENWLNSSMSASLSNTEEDIKKDKAVKFTIAEAAKSRFKKPEKGDRAPLFTAKTMAGSTVSLIGLAYNKPLSVVFVDSLCPMPHFPDCEEKLEKINELVATDTSREWIGIVSSYYVNEDIVQQFRDKFQLNLPLIFDTNNQIYQSYGVHSSPYQIDINREGTIRYRGANIH